MKVSIGSKIVRGPWGGGNLFAINLSNYLISNGHDVRYDLTEPDIDLILLTDPRSRGESSSTFNHIDIEQYKKYVNPNVAVVQRINECDERKDTNNINKFYLDASETADHVVFVSSWLRNIYVNIGMNEKKTSVILAGANKEIFNTINSNLWEGEYPVKIVTHHWSSHKNKGFDVYKKIDNLINQSRWSGKIEFTYIGNMNSNYEFNNTSIVKPLAGIELANEIKKHHLYVTASVNEPSGNHHIEAAQCGLPILYKKSGGVPEYCDGYGIDFSDNFEEKLKEVINEYDEYRNKLNEYPFNSGKMCEEFVYLFEKLISKKKNNEISNNKLIGKSVLAKNKYMKLVRLFAFSNIKNNLIKIVRIFIK